MCINVTHMKKTYILIVLLAALMLSGCDFFRRVAGRPTSEDIETKRVEIVRVEEQKVREQARLDSIAAALEQARIAEEQAAKDSLAALDALKEKGCMMYNLSSLKGLSSGELQHGYYIVVGSFKDAANADKFIEKVSKTPDMDPVKVRFRTGMVAVGVCPRNRIAEIAAVIDDVKANSFCPKDAWILVNEE